jgi:hypothetical protein
MKPQTQTFLIQLSRSSNAIEVAVADNCRFDERVAMVRWDKFEANLPENPDWADWNQTNQDSFDGQFAVPRTSVPDSFLEINEIAWLQGIETNRSLVRLEHLSNLLNAANLTFDQLLELLNNKNNAENQSKLKQVIDDWNGVRDGRPMFAAFYDEVQTEADHADWQHQLRDRLGLGHYGSDRGVSLPVALMGYSLDVVVSASSKIPTPFALPTVLDGGMHEFYFPVPKLHPYGATLHLAPNQADSLTAEILHYRIDYQVEHLWKIGWITRPHNVENDDLRSARDLHLLALQEATNRADFGETMVGRK